MYLLQFHDLSFINTKAFANLKGSGGNIWEVFEVLDDARRAIFRDTVFGYFIDVPRLQGDDYCFIKCSFIRSGRTLFYLQME
uniref:Uncharacterized protein n=1 Tax=Lactuca sativa TaxID=4236 RepID=A0A9R1WY51_LACSA|nr:hypothetical protein LSAT_V11C800402280 [Lactuca sativa]